MKFKKNLVFMLLMGSLSIFGQSTVTTSSSSTVSISISDGNSNYAFAANFSSTDVNEIKQIIEKYFGKSEINSKIEKWEKEDIYSIHLKSSGKLSIALDKENASISLTNKVINMGKEIDKHLNETK